MQNLNSGQSGKKVGQSNDIVKLLQRHPCGRV